MLNVLFWNLKSQQLGVHLSEMCGQYDVDLILIAEPPSNKVRLSTDINSVGNQSTYVLLYSALEKFALFTRFPINNIRLIYDDDDITIREILSPVDQKILVCGVHLPSKLHYEGHDQTAHASEVVRKIRKAESSVNNTCTLVIGDFNMNPFDHGMVSASAFNAVMDKRIAR